MNLRPLKLACACIALGYCAHPVQVLVAPDGTRHTYPPAARKDHVDVYHGERVADPYRWLEDLDSAETRTWVEGENRLTESFLGAIAAREKIAARVRDLWNFERYGVPVRRGNRYFFTKNDGLQNQSVLCVADALDGQSRVLFDPNALSPDATVSLVAYVPSDDGRHVAVGLATAGSDRQQWRVIEAATGKDLGDRVEWTKLASVAWTRDGRGFYYDRYPEPEAGTALKALDYNNTLNYHRLGSAQSADLLVYARPDQKEWRFAANATDDGKYLVVIVEKGTDDKKMVLVGRLDSPGGKLDTLVGDFEAGYGFVGSSGSSLWFRTTRDAKRGKIVAVDVTGANKGQWREIVGEAAEPLEAATCAGGRIIAQYLKDARSQLRVYSADGDLLDEPTLPGMGTILSVSSRCNKSEAFYSFASFSKPATVYRYDVKAHSATAWREPRLGFDPSAYVTDQVFYTSKDKTRVPIFLSHKKGQALDADTPTLLYGYGGFNVAVTPWFDVAHLVWMQLGGVLAVANIRGGGEYGEAWHEAGRLAHKQNVFDDFIAAAEWLVASRYTSPKRLAIEGKSNGGLLVGAVVNQRPDLFAAALPGVGVMDMLRFHKFTIGWSWADDYGCADDPQQFRTLYAYSPLHNVKAGTHYPAVLITTGDHDDRVFPAHSFKYAAALQAAQTSPAPVLVRIENRAGHGAGKPVAKRIEQAADELAFVVNALGVSGGEW